jgi:hypothetical protein
VISGLHPRIAGCAGEFARQFAENQPFRHVVIDEFLDPGFCEELIASFPAFEAGQSTNERGEPGRKAVRPDLSRLGPAYARFDRLMKDAEFLALIGSITGIQDLLYDPEYVGGGTHENLDGQELDTHVDFNYHPRTRLHRRLNLIVFLNPRWEHAWGGHLELLKHPWSEDDRAEVVPLANRCVIFETTEQSWHGFRRIQLPAGSDFSRRSIAVYFYTAARPLDQAAVSHQTVYYQRPLPDRFQPGHALSENDVTEMQVLLARRDKQIQFLYDRERKFSELITGITDSPSFRIGRALTWPARIVWKLLKGGSG